MEVKNKPIILKTLSKDERYPYFFKNENIDDGIYIVQRAHNISNAIFIIDTWNNERYNVGEIDQYIDVDVPYNEYLYNSNNNIIKKKINGGDDNRKILVYKKDGQVYVSALLKFK